MTAQNFREEVKQWLQENFPHSLKDQQIDMEGDGQVTGDWEVWRSRLAEKGWGAPTWPVEFGGAGLSQVDAKVINGEMAKIGAINHIPLITGMGITMVGPTVLEYGTDEQKQTHLPSIASGEIRWCLGLSEPNAGSDLAALATKAEDDGDNFILNGQKIWTSGAHISQWCGALVRTDANVAKRDGISFVLLPMDQEGVETRLIKLISGASPFCETYFNNAVASKADLLGDLNSGWSVVKRLLQHERQSQTGGRSAPSMLGLKSLQARAVEYVGVDDQGKLNDTDLRHRITKNIMEAQAHSLTAGRIAAEAAGNPEVSAVASILKNSNTRVAQTRAELTMEVMGSRGLGWEANSDHDFAEDELGVVREWLMGKAMSIYGGSYEVQNNIISKNILGLPETTQKG